MNKKIFIIILAATAAAVVLIWLALGRFAAFSSNRASSGLSAQAVLTQAKQAFSKGDLSAAKSAYLKLIGEFPGSSQVMDWQKELENINMRLLFSPAVTPGSLLYEIKPGDSLIKIARQFKTTPELLKKSNNLQGDTIMPGRKIKVWNTPFNILVDKSQNTLTLKAQDEIIKVYRVSTGKNNSTPTGTFKIVNKLSNPTWFKAGTVVPPGSAENILGTRWLGFDLAGYGIHGTTEPQSLGSQVTQGCVRMANPEVEELYAIIPEGTLVTIAD